MVRRGHTQHPGQCQGACGKSKALQDRPVTSARGPLTSSLPSVPTSFPAVHFKNLRGILVSPLPRIYDEGPNGVQPLDGEARLLGANMDFELIPKAAEEARRRIQVEVLDPLHEWMGIYRQIMVRGWSTQSLDPRPRAHPILHPTARHRTQTRLLPALGPSDSAYGELWHADAAVWCRCGITPSVQRDRTVCSLGRLLDTVCRRPRRMTLVRACGCVICRSA